MLAFEKVMEHSNIVPISWSSGRIVFIPKIKDLSGKKNHHPIICLNTLYKLFIGLVTKYMRDHVCLYICR